MLASVLINNYNYADYLEKCIESVRNQTYTNVEIIVYDDGSTDHSLEVLSKFKDIKVISKHNYGKNHILNQMNAVYQAFLQSKGSYIFLLDSDDWFREDKVEKVIRAFNKNDIEVVQHSLEEADKYGNSNHAIVPVLKNVTNYKEYINSTQSLFHLFATTSALAFKRSFLEKVMPLQEDENSYLGIDIRLMLHAAITSSIYTIFEPLSFYRRHGTNDSNKYSDTNGYKQFITELYSFYNAVSAANENPIISYSYSSFLENNFFFRNIDIDVCKQFISDDEYWIWGAGEAGQSICHALHDKSSNCLGFIDRDSRKHNHIVMDKIIVSPDSLDYNSNIKIIVSPYHVYDAIKSDLVLKNIKEGLHFIDPYIRKKGDHNEHISSNTSI